MSDDGSPQAGILGLPLAMLGAVRAATDLLGRANEIERSLARGGAHVQQVLDDVLERLKPLEDEIDDLRESAKALTAELEETRAIVSPLSRQVAELHATIARLEGSLEHVIDRVPGLSADEAAERGEEIAEAR